MLDKKLIKRAFSRAASTYDDSAELQKDVCHELAAIIERMLPHNTCRILDAGAGTGRLAASAGGIFPDAFIAACDIAHPMLVRARDGRVRRAVCADFNSLPFTDGFFDAVISSLACQWADRPERVFKEARRVLKPGGYFIFSTLGPATLHELRESFNVTGPMRFTAIHELKTALEAAGFEVVTLEQRPRVKVYRDLIHLLKTLKGVGALGRAGGGGLSNKSQIEEAGRIYRKRFPAPDKAGIAATYDVIFAAARRF